MGDFYNSFYWINCGRWIQSGCTKVKLMASMFYGKIVLQKMLEWWWNMKKSYVIDWKKCENVHVMAMDMCK